MIFLLVFKLLHISPIWNKIFTDKPYIFWHSLVTEHTDPRSCLYMSSSHDRCLLFWSVLSSVQIASFCLHYRFRATRGRCFSLCSCWEQDELRLFFAQEQRVYFLILCNEDQIISLLNDRRRSVSYAVSVCLFISFFLITCAFTSQRLWTDELFFHLCSVRLSSHSNVPLSFKVTTETCATRWKISISSSASVQPVMFSVQNVFVDPNWKVSYVAYTVAFSISDKGNFKGHPRSARQIEPPNSTLNSH